MAEWKTWSLGGASGKEPHGDGGGDEPGRPLPPGAAERWGTEVTPFTLERAARVVQGDGFPVTRDEAAIGVLINSLPMRLHREPADAPWAQFEAHVPLPDGMDEGAPDPFDLQQTANTWNSQHLQPTVIPARSDERFFFHLSTRFFVGEGLSDRQIHLMIARGVVVTLQAARQLPGLVTPPEDA
jgi:hypothetical protein